MKKLFSLMLAAFIGLTAFAAEEKSLCPAGTLADGKVTHELECCTIVQEQGEATTALKSVSPWQAPPKSIMTITPKEGVSIEQFIVNTKNTTLGTYIGKSELTNATKTAANNGLVTFAVTNGIEPVVMKFVSATIKFCELTIIYTQEGGSVTPEPEDTTVVTPEPQPTTETVYFINNQGWAKVNAYAWTNNDPIVAWPGAAATKESEQIGGYDVYSYTLEAGAAANVIFNNGSGQQTADLKWTAGQYVIKNQWYTKEEAEAQLAKPAEYEYIYFVNVQNWAAVKIYTWTPAIAEWPGVAMTKEADQIGGYDVYSYKADKGSVFAGMLFNNGNGTQTDDLTWTPGEYFVKDKWYTKEAAIEKLGGTTVLLPTVALAGDMNAWSTTTHELMAAEDQKTASITAQLAADSTYAFKMVVDGAWLGNLGTMTRDNCTDWIFEALDGAETNAHITADVAGDYIFTWTYETKTLTVTYPAAGEEPEDTTIVTPEPEPTVVYTVAGQPAALFGTEWDAANAANNMTLQADGTYKWEKADVELEAGKVEYKVVKDGNWNTSYPTAAGVNAEYTIAQKGKYDVTITFNPTTTDLAMNAVLDGDIVTPEPEDTTIVTPPIPAEIWTVAGSESAFGTKWDPANTANIMTAQADGTYKLEKTDLALPAGNIEFKVVKGDKWGEEYPSENYVLSITEQGLYTLVIVFDPATKNITASATKVGNAEVEDKVSIAGEMTDWVEQAMTISEGVATITMALEAKDYLFKIVENGSWLTNADKITRETSSNVSLPIVGGMDNDITLVADVAGDYTFSWNLDKKTLTVTYPAAGEEPGDDPVDPNPGDDPVVDPDGDVWTVLGVDALGLNWTIDATDNDMVKQEDGSYKLVKENLELGAGNYDYKVAKNHSWDVSIPAGQPNQTLTIETSGVYNVTFVLDAACTTLTATAELVQAGEVIPVVGMHGNFLGSWADTEKFTMVEDKLTASLVLTIPVGEYEFGMQIAGVWTANGTAFTRENTSAVIVGTSPNNTLSADVEGEYTFTWTYETSTLTIAYPVAGDDPVDPETAVDNVAVGEKAVKVIRNGQMYIIRNGVIYNAMGQIAE